MQLHGNKDKSKEVQDVRRLGNGPGPDILLSGNCRLPLNKRVSGRVNKTGQSVLCGGG